MLTALLTMPALVQKMLEPLSSMVEQSMQEADHMLPELVEVRIPVTVVPLSLMAVLSTQQVDMKDPELAVDMMTRMVIMDSVEILSSMEVRSPQGEVLMLLV